MTYAVPPAASSTRSQIPRELITLLQLGRRVRSADSVEALGFILVNESRQLFEYRQAALWSNGKIAAVSGAPRAEPNAPYVQWLRDVCRALDRDGDTASRVVTAADLSPVLAESWAEWLPAQALWIPLAHNGRQHGALLFAGDDLAHERVMGQATEIGSLYAHALASFALHRPMRRRLSAALRPTGPRIAVGVALLAVALFPVRQSVSASAEVVPLDPFLVRAPLDGVIDKFLVRPNQLVKAGEPLFAMDVTALQTRNEVARTAYSTALEEYRQSAQAAVTDDKSRLDVALHRGELRQRTVELEYATNQLGRVQVKAERDGLAVFADVNDWQGKAVQLGERVLTLADPAKMALSIEFPASRSFDLRIGAPVTLYPNDSLLLDYEARVTQISYHAEPGRDGVLTYRLKAELVTNAQPRIGLMGTAKLTGDRVPLVYYALRRPFTALRQWLGW